MRSIDDAICILSMKDLASRLLDAEFARVKKRGASASSGPNNDNNAVKTIDHETRNFAISEGLRLRDAIAINSKDCIPVAANVKIDVNSSLNLDGKLT